MIGGFYWSLRIPPLHRSTGREDFGWCSAQRSPSMSSQLSRATTANKQGNPTSFLPAHGWSEHNVDQQHNSPWPTSGTCTDSLWQNMHWQWVIFWPKTEVVHPPTWIFRSILNRATSLGTHQHGGTHHWYRTLASEPGGARGAMAPHFLKTNCQKSYYTFIN